ncbi:twin transmembrane helix small protein [Candidatus Pelagibacter sp.]|nr:twin transmembrane helix small protein [Candidatus Pelagibacter sp.]
MISEIFVKIAAIILLAAVAVVLILGIRTLFKGDGDKKTSNKLMQLRVLLQFVAIIVLVALAYFYKN